MKNLLKAFHIFEKYIKDYPYPTHCEHDVMYVDCDYSIVSAEDIEELEMLGFVHDEDNDKFLSYVFGSY